MFDGAAVATLVRNSPTAVGAWLERIGATPTQGVSSMFAFGRAAGVVESVLATAGVPVSYGAPAAWKRALAVPAGKDGARLRASQLLRGVAAGEGRRASRGGADRPLRHRAKRPRMRDEERIHGRGPSTPCIHMDARPGCSPRGTSLPSAQ
jgi:hypothetical protein